MGCSSSTSTNNNTSNAKSTPPVRPSSTKSAVDKGDLASFLKSTLSNNAIFDAELKFQRASVAEVEDIDSVVETIVASCPPSIIKKNQVIVSEGIPLKNKIIIIYQGSFSEYDMGSVKGATLLPGTIYGEEEFFIAGRYQLLGDEVLTVSSDTERKVKLIAEEQSVVVEVTKEFFRSIVVRDLPLRDVELLKPLSDEQLEELSDGITMRDFSKGDVIFAENDRVIGLYIIASGLVHVAGDTTRLSSANKGPLLLPGEYFGDYAVIMNEIQPYTVTAFSDVRTYKLSANACKSPAFEEVYTRLEAAFADASLAARKLDRKKSSRSGARRRRSHEVVLWHEGEAVPLGGEQLGEGEVRNAADIASIGVTVSTDEYDFTPRPPM